MKKKLHSLVDEDVPTHSSLAATTSAWLNNNKGDKRKYSACTPRHPASCGEDPSCWKPQHASRRTSCRYQPPILGIRMRDSGNRFIKAAGNRQFCLSTISQIVVA
jgi:hypothetical protein